MEELRLFLSRFISADGTAADTDRTQNLQKRVNSGPKNVRSHSSDGQHDPLPLRPPPLPLLQFPRGLREERDLLSALDLPLEELQRRAVEAHHVLAGSGGGDEEEPRRGGSDVTDTHSDLAHLGHGVGAQLVHDRQQHLVTGDLPKMDPGRSPSPR